VAQAVTVIILSKAEGQISILLPLWRIASEHKISRFLEQKKICIVEAERPRYLKMTFPWVITKGLGLIFGWRWHHRRDYHF